MQFDETNVKQGFCPVCGKEVPVRSVRDVRKNVPNYCSKVCSSKSRYMTRYRGSSSGPMDRPSVQEKNYFES